MKLQSFDNTAGEGVVTFEPSAWPGDEYKADTSRWYHHLLVSGKRVFEYGNPCGTCGILFRKVGSVSQRVDDSEASELLGRLEAVPSQEALAALARVLEPGVYYPLILEGRVEAVEPGGPRDFFAVDVVRLFGLEPPEYEEPPDPGTPYYRFGTELSLERTGRLGGPHKALVTSVIMPLYRPDLLQRERIEFWKNEHRAGTPLTALAVSVIDDQAPAMYPNDRTYQYEEQFLFTNCLLDGHHRLQAAAEVGADLRILALLALGSRSLVDERDVSAVLAPFQRKG